MSYVHHRMEVAGWRGAPVFGEATIEQVHDLTGGNPRRINLLCTRLLLAAFVERRLQVDAAKVQAMAAEVDGRPVTLAVAPSRQRRKWPPA
jgi:type II secretory pathway predicted ATPase ExeA